MINVNLNNIEIAGSGFGRQDPPAGGYVCRIISTRVDEKKQCLFVDLDIAEGDYADHFRDVHDRTGYWFLTLPRSFKPRALPFFKRFTHVAEQSNQDYWWTGDETKLEGLLIGATIYREEYIGNDGKKKSRTKVDEVYTVDQIRAGKFKTPEDKPLEEEQRPAATVFASEEDIPF